MVWSAYQRLGHLIVIYIFTTKFMSDKLIWLIVSYVPCYDNDKEVKDTFFTEQERGMWYESKRKTVSGDMNECVEDLVRVVGRQGIPGENDNSEETWKICASAGKSIENRNFQHKDVQNICGTGKEEMADKIITDKYIVLIHPIRYICNY